MEECREKNGLASKCFTSLKLEFSVLGPRLGVLEQTERLTDSRMVFPTDAYVSLVATLAD